MNLVCVRERGRERVRVSVRWVDKTDLIMFMKTPTARARTRLLAVCTSMLKQSASKKTIVLKDKVGTLFAIN